MLEIEPCTGLGGRPVRGRKPRRLTLAPADLPILEAVAHSRRLAFYQVQHARIALAVAAGEPIQAVAARLECDRATVWRLCRRYEQGGLTALLVDEPRVGRPQEISPLQRAQIVALACLEPVAKGLHLTHWTSEDLARQAVAEGIVAAISPRTVRHILNDVDLQPHRTRYWRTARLDEQFKERAEKVLWCYGHAQRLARQGLWVVAVDEKPNHQVLERRPIRRSIPGFIERQEFEYTRHGTVNLLLFLIVHSGQMEIAVEAKKDAEHYVRELTAFRSRHEGLKGVFLVQDGDPSHGHHQTAVPARLAFETLGEAVPVDAGTARCRSQAEDVTSRNAACALRSRPAQRPSSHPGRPAPRRRSLQAGPDWRAPRHPRSRRRSSPRVPAAATTRPPAPPRPG
jgi:transposase